MSEHTFTPGPWRLHDMERATIVAGKPGGEVANCLNGFGDQDANAEEIIHRFNCHDDLLDALEAALPLLEGFDDHDYPFDDEEPIVAPVIKKARAAIAKAKGTP